MNITRNIDNFGQIKVWEEQKICEMFWFELASRSYTIDILDIELLFLIKTLLL